MENTKPRHRRLLRMVLVLVMFLGGAAGAGWYYLNAAGNVDAAEDGTSQTTDAADGEKVDSPEGESDQAGEDGAGEDKKDEEGEDGEEEKKDAAVPVSVAQVNTGTVSSYLSATANLVAENEVKILAEADGRVEQVLVEEGDSVSRNALMAGLVREDAQILVEKAQVKEANARGAYERAARMADQSMISPEEFDNTTRDHRIAQQELAEAMWALDKTEVRSPFSGRVTERMVTVGQHVQPGDELFTVMDFDPLIARIFLPEKDVIGLSKNRDVRITLKADESVRFRGRIRQISPVVDTTTGTVKLTIEAYQPPQQVRPGGFVTVDIIKETHPNVILLPREAVIRELQRAHVFIVKEDGKAEKRTVNLGLEEGENIEIVSGLEAGEEVIVAGQGSLKNGAKVKIIPVATAKDASARNRKVKPARG